MTTLPEEQRCGELAPALVTSVVAELLVGLELACVEAVVPTGSGGPPTRRVDLAQVLGVQPAAAGRTLVTRVDDGETCEVLVGEAVVVVAARAAVLQPLPALLEGLTERAAIGSLFLLAERIGFLVDASRLLALATAGDRR